MATFQSSLIGISKKNKKKPKTDKDEITAQMRSEMSELKEDMEQKFAKVTTDVEEQNKKISAVLTCTEEMKSWSHKANCVLHEIQQGQRNMMDKLDNLESRARRNHLWISNSDSVAEFMDKWLHEEFIISSDLQIQRAHQALVPKSKTGQPARSIVFNFQQFTVKESVGEENYHPRWRPDIF